MGANVSTSDTQVLTQTITDISTNLLNSIVNSTSTNSSLVQRVSIDIQGKLDCGSGSISITNDGKSTVAALSQISAQQIADLSNTLTTGIQTQLEKLLEQKNSDLNLGQANVSVDATKITNSIANKISTTISTSLSNNISISSNTDQGIKFSVGKQGSVVATGCIFGNTQVISQVASNISSNIMSLIENNDVATDILNKYKSTITQSNAGVSMWAIVALVGVVIIGFFLGGGKVMDAFTDPKKVVAMMMAAVFIYLVVAGFAGWWPFSRTSSEPKLDGIYQDLVGDKVILASESGYNGSGRYLSYPKTFTFTKTSPYAYSFVFSDGASSTGVLSSDGKTIQGQAVNSCFRANKTPCAPMAWIKVA
jgi:hypothetical protein